MTRDRSADCSRRLRSMPRSVANIAFPAPDLAVFGVGYFADEGEAAFGEHARRCVWFRERVGADEVCTAVGDGKVDEGVGGFGGEALALVCGDDAVGDFYDAVLGSGLGVEFWRGWSFETAYADDDVLDAVDDREAEDPGVWFNGRSKLGEIFGGDFAGDVEVAEAGGGGDAEGGCELVVAVDEGADGLRRERSEVEAWGLHWGGAISFRLSAFSQMKKTNNWLLAC